MEEIFKLRQLIEQQRYPEALNLIGEMEEMSKDDKINKIISYMEILLLHLIKQTVEKRSTKSWDVSIKNCLYQIARTNKRRKAGGYYLTEEDLKEALEEAWIPAIRMASLETANGKYDEEELLQIVDKHMLLKKALELILIEQQNR